MPVFKFTYDYQVGYVVTVEAPNEQIAQEMFDQGKGLSKPTVVHEEMLDTVEIVEVVEPVACSQCGDVVDVENSTEISNSGVFYCEPCWSDYVPEEVA